MHARTSLAGRKVWHAVGVSRRTASSPRSFDGTTGSPVELSIRSLSLGAAFPGLLACYPFLLAGKTLVADGPSESDGASTEAQVRRARRLGSYGTSCRTGRDSPVSLGVRWPGGGSNGTWQPLLCDPGLEPGSITTVTVRRGSLARRRKDREDGPGSREKRAS